MLTSGIQNAEGFLAPYRWQKYHLIEWSEGNPPTSPKEIFNMRHSSAQNVIERAFRMLKGQWDILRGKSYYSVNVQCIIHACCLLHNLVIQEMGQNSLLEEGQGKSRRINCNGRWQHRICRDIRCLYCMEGWSRKSDVGWMECKLTTNKLFCIVFL